MNIEDLNRRTALRFLHKPATAPPSMTPEPWTIDALCAQVDPELFFPEHGGPVVNAKKICDACPVRVECLAYGMSDPNGVYGGLSARERRDIRNGRVA